jgi:hypothetical protein
MPDTTLAQHIFQVRLFSKISCADGCLHRPTSASRQLGILAFPQIQILSLMLNLLGRNQELPIGIRCPRSRSPVPRGPDLCCWLILPHGNATPGLDSGSCTPSGNISIRRHSVRRVSPIASSPPVCATVLVEPALDPIEPRAQAVCRTPIPIRTGKRRSTSAIRNRELAAVAPGRKGFADDLPQRRHVAHVQLDGLLTLGYP